MMAKTSQFKIRIKSIRDKVDGRECNNSFQAKESKLGNLSWSSV